MNLPITFLLGGETISGIPESWHPSVTGGEGGVTVYGGISPEGLEVRVEHRKYADFDGEEWVAFLTNRGNKASPLLENARLMARIPGKNALLYHGNGDTKEENGYQWWTTPVTAAGLTLAPCGDGTSCNGAFPYMRLLFEDRGVNFAIGWTGTWTADIGQKEDGVWVSVGQKRCRMVIHPGETVRLPSLTLLSYEGDEDAGRNTWRRWYFAHIMPPQKGRPLEPKCCMHLFQAGGKPEFTGATEENQLGAIDAYLQAGIHPDVWWVDAGWYPCDFQWANTGNWYPNPEHFPRGLKPLGDKCRASGMDFLLWFEPERVRKGTAFADAHPRWCLHSALDDNPNPNLLVNLGDPACCAYMIELLDGFIKEFGVDIYRQDFNLRTDRGAAALCWQEAEAADRIGAVENQHIQGYYRLWDTLLERNPGLLIDSCASGGRRNDLQTMRRSVPLHYTDVGYGNHPVKLKQHRQMFEWIPYFRAHNMNWCDEAGHYDKVNRAPDRFSYYAAMAPAITDMTACDAGEEAFALAREMQALWRKAAGRMIGTDYYPLTKCRGSSDDFYAAQFHDPASERGLVHLLNGATAKETAFTLRCRGLTAQNIYAVTSAEQKKTRRYTGAELMAGVAVRMEKRSGDLWFYEKA